MNSKAHDERVGTAVETATSLAFEPVHDWCVYVSGDQRFVPLRFWQAHRSKLAAQQRLAADRVRTEAYARLLADRGPQSMGPLGVG
jgi:hypothetical protein